MRWLERITGLFRRPLEVDLDEEIAYHLELETRRQIDRGLTPAAARARAVQRFGNPARIADATRDERPPRHLEGGMQDIHYALRSLRKTPGFAGLALFTLALGIGVTTVAYSVLDTVLVRPLPFRQSERLVLIQEMNDKGSTMPPSFPDFVDWRDKAPGFDGIASEMFPFTTTVVVDGEPERIATMGVSRGFFQVLGAPPAVGREFTAQENSVGGPFAVMVTWEYWKTRLGGRMPLGTVEYGDRPVPIVGVAPPGFRLVGDADFFFPHEQWGSNCRSCHNYVVVGRVAAGTSIEAGQAAMTAAQKALRAAYGTDTEGVDASVTPLRDYLVRNVRVTLAAVFSAAALVLIIACTNLVTAQLARGLTREREVAVRAALGASRGRIVRQLFLESLILAVGGALLGVALAFALVVAVKSLGAGLLPRLGELAIDGRILGFTIALTALTSVLIGLYPAIQLSSARPGDAIRGAARDPRSGAASRVWPALIGFEIAVAVVLTIGSGLMLRTMRNIISNDVGFDPRGIVTVQFSYDSMPLSDLARLRGELASAPGATDAAYVTRFPLSWGNENGPLMRPTDVWPKFPTRAGFRAVSAGYFSVMRQPMLRGRAFTSADVAASTRVAIITPGVAQVLWPGENPLGKQVKTAYLDSMLTVVGVVAEASSWSQPRGTQNEIFVPLAQVPVRARQQLVAVVRTSGDPRAAVAGIRARLREAAPALAAKFDTIEDRISRTAADRRFAMYALLAFASIALLLAGVGIYGVMSYAVAARTHEIGVRMALGATPGGILGLMLRSAVVMAVIGVVLGVGGGWMATRYITSILYGVTGTDPVVYGGGVAFLFAAALAGALAPALRSSRVDPLVAIRGE
jgi:predicted permease